MRRGDPGLGLVALAIRRAVVARADHRRKNETIEPVFRQQQLGVAQFDIHHIAGKDVGDIHLEHVLTLLLQQGGGLACALGLLELDLGLLLLADLRLQLAIAEAYRHAIDRRPGRTGKHIARLKRPCALVAVLLDHPHIGDHTQHPRLDPGGFQRQPVERRIPALDGEVGAVAVLAGRRGAQGGQQQAAQEQQATRTGTQG